LTNTTLEDSKYCQWYQELYEDLNVTTEKSR
jgi:hypothetical protein